MLEERQRENRATICIMADFGMAPYAWLRKPGDSPPHVGSCVASDGWISDELKISSQLRSELENWAIEFERDCDKPSFDWKEWNKRGIDMASKLKREVGDEYLVEYHVPMEDPSYSDDKGIIQID